MEVEDLLGELNQYLSKVRTLNEDNAKEMAQHFRGRLGKLHIGMNYDPPHTLQLQAELKKKYPAADIHLHLRFILSANRAYGDHRIPLVRASNGLVIVVRARGFDTDLEAKVVFRPPPDLTLAYEHEALDAQLTAGTYEVYQMNDGTTINLYYDADYIEEKEGALVQGKWIYFTHKTLNIELMTWRGYPYLTAIEQVLAQYHFSTESLDRAQSYCFGIHHPAYHWFLQKKKWERGSVLDDNFRAYAWAIQPASGWQLPEQKKVEPKQRGAASEPKASESERDAKQRGAASEPKASESESVSSLNVESLLASANRALDAYLVNGSVNLGYLLRSKVPTQPDVMIESTLWRRIRALIYQLHFDNDAALMKQKEVDFKDSCYVVLSQYLHPRQHDSFIRLFPQFLSDYRYFDSLIRDTVAVLKRRAAAKSKVIESPGRARNTFSPAKQRGAAPSERDAKASEKASEPSEHGTKYRGATNEPKASEPQSAAPDAKIVEKLADRFGDILGPRYDIQNDKVVIDLIRSPTHLDIFYELIYLRPHGL